MRLWAWDKRKGGTHNFPNPYHLLSFPISYAYSWLHLLFSRVWWDWKARGITLRAKPPLSEEKKRIASNLWGLRSSNSWTSHSCLLSPYWFLGAQASVYWQTDGYNRACCTKRMAIRPGFETISQQHATHAQQRSYSIHAESFSRTQKSSQRKKGSAGRVAQS